MQKQGRALAQCIALLYEYHTCTRVTAACRTHAYSRDAEVPHPRVRRIYTRTRRRSSRRALHHHAVERGECERKRERERSIVQHKRERDGNREWDAEVGRERERERKRDRERGNTGRCTWKLCGAVKPRRLLFTICRDHTKFIRRDHTTPIDTWGRPLFRVRASPYPNYPHVARVGRYTPAVLIANHCGRREKGPWLLSCVLDNEIRRKLCHNRYRKLTLRQLPQLCIQSQRRQCRHSHGILRRNRTSGLKRIAHWEVLQERRKKHRKVASRFTLQLPKLCFILNFSRYFCENMRWCVRT